MKNRLEDYFGVYLPTTQKTLFRVRVMKTSGRKNFEAYAGMSPKTTLLITNPSEQDDYALEAAKAAFCTMNPVYQNQLYTSFIDLTLEQGRPQGFGAESASVGLCYALSLSLSWHALADKTLHLNSLVFCTGEVLADGTVKQIGGLALKVAHILLYVKYILKKCKAQGVPCIFVYPKANQQDFDLLGEDIHQEMADVGLQSIAVSHLSEALHELFMGEYDGRVFLSQPKKFLGIKSFNYVDRHQYFGRKDAINALEEDYFDAEKQNKALVVFGPSGAGKSSLVKAPLVHRLTLRSNLKLQHVVVTPSSLNTDDDLKALCKLILEPISRHYRYSELPSHWIELFLWSPLHLIELLNEEAEGKGPFLLIVDQYEELFSRFKFTEEDVERISKGLNELTKVHGVNTILTIKAEYLICFGIYGLQSPVHYRLRSDDVALIVRQQAKWLYMEYDEGLDNLIIDDALELTGPTLPALAVNLSMLQKMAVKADPNTKKLLLADYIISGGVKGVISQQAGDILGTLIEKNPELQGIFFETFFAFTEKGTVYSKALSLKDVEILRPKILEIVKRLSEKGLLTGIGKNHDLILTNEALFESWPPFKLWVDSKTGSRFFVNYEERWGVPVGIRELDGQSLQKLSHYFRLDYKAGRLKEISCLDRTGLLREDPRQNKLSARTIFHYYENGLLSDKLLFSATGGLLDTYEFRFLEGKKKAIIRSSDTTKLNQYSCLFDSHGRTIERTPQTYKSIAARNEDGSYGDLYDYEMNEDGHLVITSKKLTKNGKVKVLSGIKQVKREYSKKGYLINEAYDDSNMFLGLSDRVVTINYKRDNNGYILKESYFSRMGLRTTIRRGLSLVKYKRGKKGHIIKEAYFGTDKKPVAIKKVVQSGFWHAYVWWVSVIRSEYYENGSCKQVSYYDLNGQCIGTTHYRLNEQKYIPTFNSFYRADEIYLSLGAYFYSNIRDFGLALGACAIQLSPRR